MKTKFIIILLFVFIHSFSQDKDFEKKINQLKITVKKENGPYRLKLLDSISDYYVFNNALENDSIIRATISYAKELDSVNIIVKQTANLINYFDYSFKNFEECKQIIRTTQPLLKRVTKPYILEDYYTYLGSFYYYMGDFDASLKAYDKAYEYAQKINSNFIGTLKFKKAVVYIDKGDFGKGSMNLKEVIADFQKKKDTFNWINAKVSMSILYSKIGFYEQSRKEREEQIQLAKELKSYPNTGMIYYNMAADDNKMNLQKERIHHLKLALEHNKASENRNYFDPVFKSTLAVAYAENDSIILAQSILEELESDPEKYTKDYNESFYLEAKKKLLFVKGDYEKAIDYGKRYLDLKQQGKQYEEIQEGEHFLAKTYEKIGNSEKSLFHYKNYTHIKDSIDNIQKMRVLAYYQTLYETEKRDLTIENQKANIALLDSKNRIMQQWTGFGGLALVSLFAFLYILRSRNFAKKEQKAQEKFTQDIIIAQEEERTRVALELHDSVGQQLMLLTRKSKDKDESIEALAKDTLQNVRTISQGLHPVVLERLGFTAGITDLITSIDANTDLFFTVDIEPIDSFLDKNKALHLYRIVQEVLSNIIKHANATSVTIDIHKVKSSIQVSIEDNGKGFDFEQEVKTSKSLGMKSLIERSKIIIGKLNIISTINEGTITQLTFPI
ncbi:conserved hypothetical protein [Flavobacterium sp. 9AF]|uniref:tetratricopeptide repeat-containing sensor histidine kinase n=1 Tax=Flavobacterium sp. 9AF TaxID=2653142 RepID=UPI0012EFFE9F|nr:ATP-binding protein [Flavobacterium sp. 9AF]VXC39357.1 conserved hypothetical protein [Flavobacterium sp. 9AF]